MPCRLFTRTGTTNDLLLIAVDTNVLLDQAAGVENVPDCLEVIRSRLKAEVFLVTPTVLQELAYQSERGSTAKKKATALTALQSLRKWGYSPVNLIAVGHGVTEQIGFKLRRLGIIPEDQVNDSLIVAEAALLGCQILLSSDSHLREANGHTGFRKCLEDCDVEPLTVASPKFVVERFGLK